MLLEDVPATEPPVEQHVAEHKRRKPTGRLRLPESLPRVEIELFPAEVKRDDGRLPLSNNASELQLRREVIGRMNWLFVGSDDGAEANAVFTSLLASCQLHGLEPWGYLRRQLIQPSGKPCRHRMGWSSSGPLVATWKWIPLDCTFTCSMDAMALAIS